MDEQDNLNRNTESRASQAPPLAQAIPPPPPIQNVDTEHLPQRSERPAPESARQLNVPEALRYLDSIKSSFHDKPEVYNKFLDTMSDFKAMRIDTRGVIERVCNLFHEHPTLMQGFNAFLPDGYHIGTTDNPDPNYITLTTPAGTTTQVTNAPFIYGSPDIPWSNT